VHNYVTLRNYLSLPKRYAKNYKKYLSRIQWFSVCLIAFCINKI
jgi:hypothetical protein